MIPLLSFVASGVLVTAGAGAAAAALGLGGRLDRLLALVTLAIAQIVATMLIAGALLEELTRGALLAANAIAAVLLVALATWHLGRLPVPRVPTLDAARASARRLTGLVRAHPWCTLLLALAGAELVWRAFAGYLLPAYGYDALWYHLTDVGSWLQGGAVGHVPFNFRSNNFPANGELTFAWVALFLRNQAWVNLVQLGFAVAGALAVAGIARTVGLSVAGALAGGALFFLTPTVLTQGTTNLVDDVFTATFLLALHFLFRYMAGPPPGGLTGSTPLVPRRSPRHGGSMLLLAGIAGGLALGAKGTGLVYCGVAAVALAVNLVLRRRDGAISWSGLAARLAVFLVPLLVLGSYWYARNWVDHSNPIYPAEVRILGHQVFVGPKSIADVSAGRFSNRPWVVQVPRSWGHDLAPWAHGEEYYRFDQRSGGFGPPFTYLELPALLALAIVSLRRDRRLLNLLVPVALIFLLQPDKWWSRHTLDLAAIGGVALVYWAERWGDRLAGRALRIAVLPLLAVSLWFSTARFELGELPRLTYTTVAGRIQRIPDNYYWAPKVASLAGSPGDRTVANGLRMPAYAFLDRVPSGSGIGVQVDATPFYSPFYGTHYGNRVYALRPSEASDLRSIVAGDGIGYLFLRRGSALDRRARADLPGVRTLFTDPTVRVYKVSRGQ
jgi:hypothetical protein